VNYSGDYYKLVKVSVLCVERLCAINRVVFNYESSVIEAVWFSALTRKIVCEVVKWSNFTKYVSFGEVM